MHNRKIVAEIVRHKSLYQSYAYILAFSVTLTFELDHEWSNTFNGGKKNYKVS
jgi:hypothetical protein